MGISWAMRAMLVSGRGSLFTIDSCDKLDSPVFRGCLGDIAWMRRDGRKQDSGDGLLHGFFFFCFFVFRLLHHHHHHHLLLLLRVRDRGLLIILCLFLLLHSPSLLEMYCKSFPPEDSTDF